MLADSTLQAGQNCAAVWQSYGAFAKSTKHKPILPSGGHNITGGATVHALEVQSKQRRYNAGP